MLEMKFESNVNGVIRKIAGPFCVSDVSTGF